MRTIDDEALGRWEAVALPVKVAHLKDGARLAFRREGDPGEPLATTVDFNSMAAAEMAIRTMSEKEIRRRLDWAKTAAGVA